MLRRLYCCLLRLHPPYFKQRFAGEMVLIFDEKTQAEEARAAAKLAADAAVSLGRQWILRPDFQEEPARPTADGMPHFLSFERYKPRRGALLYGTVLSVAFFVLFTITFKLGICRTPQVQYSSVSDSRSRADSPKKSRSPLGGATLWQDQRRARDSQVTLGPRSSEPRSLWSKFMMLFAKSPSGGQLGSNPHPAGQPGTEVPLRALAPTKAPERIGGELSDGQIQSLRIHLPHPSGKYGVARVAYVWVDGTRHEPTPKYPDARRELMVYLWYPIEHKAEMAAGAADYVPHSDLIAKDLSSAELEEGWGHSWPRVFRGGVLTDTHKQAPIAAEEGRFPLLLFSPGFGLSSTSYTAQIQEVVSHGYVVAAIEPDESAVAFPDGRVVHPAEDAALAHRPITADAWADYLDLMHTAGVPHIESRAADIRFVITQLAALESSGGETFPFAGKIDFHNVGVWGHSIGGRAAARACQLDGRIKACLNSDGVGPNGAGISLSERGSAATAVHVDGNFPVAAGHRLHPDLVQGGPQRQRASERTTAATDGQGTGARRLS